MSAAAAALRPGPPEVLELIDVPAPAPGPGEVRVRMRAAGVQPADLAVRGGWAPPGAELSYPQVPGNELAGVVDAVGPGVSAFAPGDAVIGFRTLGCYAELVVVPADQLVAKPAATPWVEAGALSARARRRTRPSRTSRSRPARRFSCTARPEASAPSPCSSRDAAARP